jgi:hypothetical protein
MDALAAEFEGRAHFPFVYVREAHPGELVPTIQSMEDKIAHAEKFREYGLKRQVLLDSLYGRVHRRYGGVSNMTSIIDHAGRIAYRAEWTVVEDIRAALEEMLDAYKRRRDGRGASTYYIEKMGVHTTQRLERQLSLGGQQAKEDMRRYREREQQQR